MAQVHVLAEAEQGSALLFQPHPEMGGGWRRMVSGRQCQGLWLWGQWTKLEPQRWHLLGGWPQQVTEHAKPCFLFCKKPKNRIYRMSCF